MYSKAFHPAFKKDLKDLPKELIEEIKKATDEIVNKPYYNERLSGILSDYYKFKLKYNKVEYRIIFTIEEKTVIFVMIKKRENLYSYLKRRLMK